MARGAGAPSCSRAGAAAAATSSRASASGVASSRARARTAAASRGARNDAAASTRPERASSRRPSAAAEAASDPPSLATKPARVANGTKRHAIKSVHLAPGVIDHSADATAAKPSFVPFRGGFRVVPNKKRPAGTAADDADIAGGFGENVQTLARDMAHLRDLFPGKIWRDMLPAFVACSERRCM